MFDWDSFYLTIGSVCAGLIGLLFVVATLTTGTEERRVRRGQKLFMTPTVFDFAVVFVTSVTAMAPGISARAMGGLLAAVSLIGLVYIGKTSRGLLGKKATEHWSDFWFYGAAPFAFYVALIGIAYAIWTQSPHATFLLGAWIVGLLLCIRNAWDLVTWLAPRG